jgi:ABC-type multidrug transport system ATPase subunit
VLTLDEVTKCYGSRPALDGVSLHVARGQVLGLLGPNGAGKSTLVSIVAGLLRPDSGRVSVDGRDVIAVPRGLGHKVGLAPQETALYEVLTVRENLEFFGRLVGLGRRRRVARIDELSAALRLETIMERPASRLSGGERRRAHTAIAFMHSPPLLLLDEPTVGADVETRTALLEVVRGAALEGAAVIYSTHYLPEVEWLGATVGMLLDGRLIATGELGSLVRAHGASVVELTFDGRPPTLDLGDLHAGVDGAVLRVEAPEPSQAISAIVAQLGSRAASLRGIEVLRPSLDSVFVSLTGRRYSPEGTDVAIS